MLKKVLLLTALAITCLFYMDAFAADTIRLVATGTQVFTTTTDNDVDTVEVRLADVNWQMPNIANYAYMDGDTLGGAANSATVVRDTSANFVLVSTHDTTGMNYTGVLGSTTRGPGRASSGDSIKVEVAYLEDGSSFGDGYNYYGTTWDCAATTLSSNNSTSKVVNFTPIKVKLPVSKIGLRFTFFPDSVHVTTGNASGLEFEWRLYTIESR